MNNPEQIPETVQPGEILAAVQLCPFGTFPLQKGHKIDLMTTV